VELVFLREGNQFIGRTPEEHESFDVFFRQAGYLSHKAFSEATADELLLFFFNQSVSEAPHGFVLPEFEDTDQAVGIEVSGRGQLQTTVFKVEYLVVPFPVLGRVLPV